MTPWVTQVRKGMVELCILAVLEKREAYGYQIVESLRIHPGLEFTESTVYPVLSRLAKEGRLSVRTEPSPAGPPRRYYRLTKAGTDEYEQMKVQWKSMAESIQTLIEGERK